MNIILPDKTEMTMEDFLKCIPTEEVTKELDNKLLKRLRNETIKNIHTNKRLD